MNKIKLIALIDDQGILHNCEGIADFDSQLISDLNSNQFSAGIDVNGKLFCIHCDTDNTVLNPDGKRIGWNAFCRIEGPYLEYLKKKVFSFQ